MNQTGKSLVPTGLYWQTRFFSATASMWKMLGNLETRLVQDEFADKSVDRPIYVTSLARAGTTIVTEMLEKHSEVTSHRYSDFPCVWTPYWRNHLLQKSRREKPELKERFHRDRILISNDSPEAVEEVLWLHFFPGWINRKEGQVLDDTSQNDAFDAFYSDHIRKLLAIRNSHRYLAKGNYNLARLKYLLRLFPDARFLVPLRDPMHHIASLAKQHALLSEASSKDSRVSRQLQASGHYEFGPGRQFVNFENKEAANAISGCWEKGKEIEGWAQVWAMTYRHLEKQLSEDQELRKAVLLFRYEDLCEHSYEVINRILNHCMLDPESFATVRDTYIEHLVQPDYYRQSFTDEETRIIHSHCDPVKESLQKHCFEPV